MIQFYDHYTRELLYPQNTKVKRLVSDNNIRKVSADHWRCLPIPGYNVRTYDLIRGMDGVFHCNCQGYQKRKDCAHRQALVIVQRMQGSYHQSEFDFTKKGELCDTKNR